MGFRSAERAPRTAAGQSAEPADVQAGHRAVHGRLHRRHRRAGVRAGRRKASGSTTPRPRRRRRCSMRCGPTTATCARRSNGDWTAIHCTTTRRRALGGQPSLVDPTQARADSASPGNAGSRNQNVYSSRITGGLVVGSPGNAKQLSPTLQRAFVVFAQNTTAQTTQLPPQDRRPAARRTRLVQPVSAAAVHRAVPGAADGDRRPIVPPRSMASRTCLCDLDRSRRADPRRRRRDRRAWRAAPSPGGLASRTVILTPTSRIRTSRIRISRIPTSRTPTSRTPRSTTRTSRIPDIENPDIENPDIENPDVENPDIENVVVANPDIDNPDIGNPDIENPDIENPDIENPDIENPDIENGADCRRHLERHQHRQYHRRVQRQPVPRAGQHSAEHRRRSW